jgi:hypothetical protein
MTRRRLTSVSIVAASGLVACFGAGPTPGLPSGAEVVYVVPQPSSGNECGTSTFIGDVAIGSNAGYLVTLPYQPRNDCNNTGGQPMQLPVAINSFAKTAPLGSVQIGEAGVAQTNGPSQNPVVWPSGNWLYQDPGTNQLAIGPLGTTIPTSGSGRNDPAALLVDGSNAYYALWSPPDSFIHLNNPYFPCCTGPNGTAQAGGVVARLALPLLAGSASPTMIATPNLACEQTKRCVVQTPTSVFYVEHVMPGSGAAVWRFDKAGSGGLTMIGMLDGSTYSASGLGADPTHVAWSGSLQFTALGQNQNTQTVPPPACAIWVYDAVNGGSPVQVFQSSKFSCLDAAVDSTSVYFAIVSMQSGDNPQLRGDGIGRISLDGSTFESIALGIDDFAGGPRRIYLDNANTDDLYAVTSLAIARIAKSALDGQHDFTN